MPKMRHPQSRKTIDVAPAQVQMYESQGWAVQQPPPKKTSAQNTNQAPAADTKE